MGIKFYQTYYPNESLLWQLEPIHFVAIDYVNKWVEAKTLCTNTTIVTVKFLYEHILTWFDYPFIIVTNQGTHFINDVIHYLTNHFI